MSPGWSHIDTGERDSGDIADRESKNIAGHYTRKWGRKGKIEKEFFFLWEGEGKDKEEKERQRGRDCERDLTCQYSDEVISGVSIYKIDKNLF